MAIKKHKAPRIRIKDAWLLRQNASEYLNSYLGDGNPLRSDDEYADIVKAYKTAWQSHEKACLEGMRDVLELDFKKNIIDVYIAPWFGAFSEPLIIGVRQEPDQFIDTLTHELLHVLLTDNTSMPDLEDTKLLSEWEELFGEQQSFRALVHIPVHAVHKAIYLDVLKEPERLMRDIATCRNRNATDYLTAWDYVEQYGYKAIIEQLKNSYKTMKAN